MRAANVKRRGPGLRVVPVHAGSRMEAWTLLAEAKTDAESPLSLRLGRSFRVAATRKVTFIIGGPYPSLTDQLIRNGLSQNERGLPGLTLVVVSPKPPSSSLIEAAQEARAALHYRDLK
jgi:hypothetical protein